MWLISENQLNGNPFLDAGITYSVRRVQDLPTISWFWMPHSFWKTGLWLSVGVEASPGPCGGKRGRITSNRSPQTLLWHNSYLPSMGFRWTFSFKYNLFSLKEFFGYCWLSLCLNFKIPSKRNETHSMYNLATFCGREVKDSITGTCLQRGAGLHQGRLEAHFLKLQWL